MAVPVITKSRVGFSTALTAMFAIGGSEVLTRAGMSDRNEAVVCGALALVGVIIWIKGRFSEDGQAEPRAKGPGERVGMHLPAKDDREVHPLAFLGHAKYWGVILVLSGGTLYLMCALVHRKPAAPTPPPPTKAPVVEAKPVVVTFPELQLQGLVNNGTNSTAIINGTTLCIGEVIGDVRLIAIGREEVTVELAGQTKVLALSR